VIAALTLLSVGLLLGLLVHGRIAPAVLFSLWALGCFLFGLIDEQALLTSYANPALASLILLLLVSLALERSVLLERMTHRLLSGRESLANFKLMGVASVFSAFLNNTAVVGILLGAVSRQKRIPASRLLIPLSYASILGGVTTLVGTSTNLVVNSFAVSNGLPPIGMFQLAWVGIPVAIVCLLVVSVSARWLPRHGPDAQDGNQPYFLEARVSQASPLAGRSIEANGLRHLNGLFLLEIERAGHLITPVGPEEVLHEDDVLLFTGEVTKFQALQHIQGLEVFGTRSDALLNANLVEAIVSSESELANKTLRDVDFRTMFGAGVVGIRRGDKRLAGQLGRIPLKAGDSLLLAVGADFAHRRNLDRNFHVLGDSLVRPRLSARQSAMALSGFALVIAGAATGLLGLLPGLMLLMCAFLATRLLTLAELRRRFPFELLMVIGSALALAKGLENSGAAQLVASVMRDAFEGHGVYGALVGVYLLALVLTELVTNNAAAALSFPIALATARAFGVDPTAFVMVVAYGASACFLLPFGYQTHLMVMSPGRYRTTDFLKTGLPVSVAYSVGVLTLTPWFFPLTAA
jgi:di/tricarboxylate transporter